MRDARGRLPLALSLVSALVILAPTLRPGYLLSYDMVFVPHEPLTADLLGLGSQTPRAVPSQLIVAVLSWAIAADWLQKIVLVAALVLAGTGAARITPGGVVARCAAAMAYLWSPYIAQRLVLGHWPVVLAYGVLPWLVHACANVRAARPRAWPQLILWLALCCAAGPPGWILAVLVGPASLLLPATGRSARQLLGDAGRIVAVLVVLALPWALPSVLRPNGIPTDRSAAEIFAVRADTPLGTVGSALLGGGSWNADVNPQVRTTLLYAVGAVLFLAIVAIGATRLRQHTALFGLFLGGLIGLLITIGSSVGVFRDALAALPGGGLLRDAQRYAAPWALTISVWFGLGVARLRREVRLREPLIVLVLLPVALLPALAWGVSSKLVPVHYPADLNAVRRVVDDDHRDGAVLVAPLTAYRGYDWNGGRPALDPLPRFFDRPVVAAGDLPVRIDGRVVTVDGDDPLTERVRKAMTRQPTARALAGVGVRFVVLDASSPKFDVTGLTVRYRGPDVTLYEVPRVDPDAAEDVTQGLTPPRVPVAIADEVTAALVLAAAWLAIRGTVIRRNGRRWLLPWGRRRGEG